MKCAYSAPIALLASNKTVTLPLDWDAISSSLSIALPDLSFPLVLAFGISVPDAKGGFNFGFPSFKFGAKGDVEEDSSESDDETKAKGGFGFGFGGKTPKTKVHTHFYSTNKIANFVLDWFTVLCGQISQIPPPIKLEKITLWQFGNITH